MNHPFKSVSSLLLCLNLAAACGNREDVQCVEDANCNLASGGRCTSATTGNRWCAYPAVDCPSGFQFSDLDVGDGVSGSCTIAFTLSVSMSGSPSGSVNSTQDGFTCTEGTCSATFPFGTQLELTSTSAPGGSFLGWSDACSGFSKCSLVMDQDRTVGAHFGVPGEALWVQQGGGTRADQARAIARGANNTLIITGEFRETMGMGSFSLRSAGGLDVFVASIDDKTGDVLWAKSFGGTKDDTGSAVAIDELGNVYIAGTFSESINFESTSLTSTDEQDGFLAKLSYTGDCIWALNFGDHSVGVGVHADRVAVAGTYSGSMNLNGSTVVSAGESDMFLVSLDLNGHIEWARTAGGPSTDEPTGLAIDNNENIVVTGTYRGPTNLGGNTVAAFGDIDIFIAKYSGQDGSHLFSKGFGGRSADFAKAVAVDSQGSIFVTGVYFADLDVGGPSPLLGTKMFIVKYSLAGAYLWARAFGEPATITGQALATNADGDVAITGIFCGTVSFGGTPVTSTRSCSQSDRDIFAVRLAGATGNHVNSIRAGGTGLDVGFGITQLPDGRTFIAGGFQGFAEFGGRGLTSKGDYDVIVLALAPL